MGSILAQIINIYIDIVVLDVILSWVVMAFPRAGVLFTIQRFLDQLVNPALFPIRRALRPYTRGMPLDFSPIVLIFALVILQALVLRVIPG